MKRGLVAVPASKTGWGDGPLLKFDVERNAAKQSSNFGSSPSGPFGSIRKSVRKFS